MKRTNRALLAGLCVALIIGAFGIAEIAVAQTETQRVHIGSGTVMHRSGHTLIVNVKEGERGAGIRKINIKSTDGVMFFDRQGNQLEVHDLRKGDNISAYRLQSRPAPVKISMSEAEVIIAEQPAAPSAAPAAPAAPAAKAAPAEPLPAQLPSTGGQLPLILLLAALSLSLAVALRLSRGRV